MPFVSSSGSSYRPTQKCRIRHCHREVGYYESSEKSSFYCPKHSCHAHKCRTPSEDGEKFCEIHAVCGQHGCSKRISEEDKSFRYSKSGTKFWFCSDHRCKVDDCYNHRRDSNTKYCEGHAKENKCEVSDCSSDRSSKHFCEKHSCQHPHCTRKTFASGRSKGKCRYHQACASPGCTRHGDVDDDNSPKTFCAYHCQCKMKHCHGIVQTGSSFCAEHECYITTCYRPRDLYHAHGTRFCQKHRCSVAECKSSIIDSKGHHVHRCPRHTCERPNCYEEARTGGSRSPFCCSHRCANTDCRNPCKVEGGLCLEEACLKPMCGLPKVDCENYCFKHITRSTRNDYPSPVPRTASHSTGRHYFFGSSGGRLYVPYFPMPPGMSHVMGSPTPGSRSREWQYMLMNRAYRDSTPRHLRH